jgi:hypothetical protein
MVQKTAAGKISPPLYPQENKVQLITFIRLFIPTILTILGVIMYLRLGLAGGDRPVA